MFKFNFQKKKNNQTDEELMNEIFSEEPENILDSEEIEQPQSFAPVNKGPFIGLVIAVIGIIILVSSIFISSGLTAKIDGTVSYASEMKHSSTGEAYQNVKVVYTYDGKEYETLTKTSGGYKNHQEVKLTIVGGDPTNISLASVSSGKSGMIFCGILFIALGILLFLNIINFQSIEYKVMSLLSTFTKPASAFKEKTSSSSFSSIIDQATDLLDKIPKKDRDNTKDDQEDRIKRRKQKEGKNKKQPSQIYTSDNILDMFDDDDEE